MKSSKCGKHCRYWSLAIAFGLLVGSSAAWADLPQADIALVLMGKTHQHWRAMRLGAQSAAQARGLSLVSLDPESEDQLRSQEGLVRRAVQLGVRSIIIAPASEALDDELAEARRHDIKVVVIDTGAGLRFDGYVASDNRAAGHLMGSYIRSTIPPGSHVGIVCLKETIPATRSRELGAEEGLGESLDVSVFRMNLLVASQAPRYLEPAAGELLKLDAIFTCNESATISLLHFLRQHAGQGHEPRLFGFDITEELLNAVKSGELAGLVAQDPFRIGELAVEAVDDVLHGEPPRKVAVPTYLVTADNWQGSDVQSVLRRHQLQ